MDDYYAAAALFADVANATPDEVRAWAYSGEDEPMQDFEMLLDGPDVLPVVIDCAQDDACPAREFLLIGLYCSVGHSQPEDRAWIRRAAAEARTSHDAAVRTWATRAVSVLDGDVPLDRAQWCGWPSLAVTHPIDGPEEAQGD